MSYISVGGKPRQFEITDPDKRIIAGFASVEIKDSHGEIVPVEELKRAMYDYMERGGLIMYGHQSLPVGKVLRWEIRDDPDTGKPGVWIEAIIGKGPIEDEIWKRVKEGEIVGFSIGGVGGRRTTKDESGEPVKEIVELGLYEISLVEEPANPEAKIEEINYYAKAKESEKSKCKKRYLVEEKGGGSHFKEMTCPDDTSRKSKFCGCVRYFMNCEKKSLDSAKKLCAYIYHQKYGKSESVDWLIEMAPHMVEKGEADAELEPVFKPFAGFKDFDECLDKMREQYGKKYSGEKLEEVARKVCGKLYWEHEGKKKKGEGEEMATVEKDSDIDLTCLKRYTWRDEDGNTHYEAIKCNRVKELIKERPSFKDKEMPFCGCIKAKMECENMKYEDARNICAWMFFARDKAEKGTATTYKAGGDIVPEDVEKTVHEPESKVNEIGSEEKEEEEVEKKDVEVEVEGEVATEAEAKPEVKVEPKDEAGAEEKELEVGEKIGATEEVVEGIKEELGELKEKISKLEKLLADLASEVEKLIISGEDTISGGAEPMSKGRKIVVMRKKKTDDEKIKLLKERIRRKLLEKLEKAEYKPKAEELDMKDVAGPRIEGEKIVEEVKELKKQIEELKKLLAKEKIAQERRPVRKRIIVRRKVKKSEDGSLKAETPRPDVTETGGEAKASGGATFKDLLLKGLQGDERAWQKLIGAVKEYEMTVRPEFASLKPFTEDKRNK